MSSGSFGVNAVPPSLQGELIGPLGLPTRPVGSGVSHGGYPQQQMYQHNLQQPSSEQYDRVLPKGHIVTPSMSASSVIDEGKRFSVVF